MPPSIPTAKNSEKNGESEHTVLFYKDAGYLFKTAANFVGNSLSCGDPAIVIGTQEHRDGLVDRLYRYGLDVAEYARSGSYIEMDAASTLQEFMVDEGPDPGRFRALVDDLFEQVRKNVKGGRRVAVFGEMVALLWKEGKRAEAIRLEELWADATAALPLSLFCAYPLDLFPALEDEAHFRNICSAHATVVPAEDYSLLSTTEERLRNVAVLQQRSAALETEARLRRSEERRRKLVEDVEEYAVFTLDTRGQVATWSASAKRLLGYDEAEILGQPFSRFFIREEELSGEPTRELRVAASKERFEGKGWRIRKYGWKFMANLKLVALPDDAGRVNGFAVVMREALEQPAYQVSLVAERGRGVEPDESLREFSLRVMRRQEEERRRVGEELLDSLGQYLSVLNMNLDCMRFSSEEHEATSEAEYAQCLGLVEESIKEVRSISYLLYPPLLEEVGLRSAVPWYLEGFSKRSGIKTQLSISPDLRQISSDVGLTIFRVLQEALANVQRHSGSDQVEVQLLTKDQSVVLVVKDAGKGLPPEHLRPNSAGLVRVGIGLRGMSERVRDLGGSLEVTSSPRGVTVTATIPYSRCAAAAISA